MTGASQATGLGSAEAPEPSGLRPTGAIPCASFTPGPWGKNCSHIYAPDGAIIAVVHNPGSKASDYPLVANRDLMTTAPELYAELADALPRNVCLTNKNVPDSTIIPLECTMGDLRRISALLAKARGEQVQP